MAPSRETGNRIADALEGMADFETVALLKCESDAISLLETSEARAAVVQLAGARDEFALARASERRFPAVYVANSGAGAVEAFEMNAVDYMVMPWTSDRFDEALGRLRSRVDRGETRPEGNDGGARREDPLKSRYLAVRDGEAYRLIAIGGLQWAEAARNYVRLYTDEGQFSARMTLADLEARLDESDFVRIHRSALVNARRVRRILPLKWGDCTVELDTGAEVRMSRTYRSRLL